MRVKILNSDERLGVKAGEVYEAHTYGLDPEKVTLDARVPDGYDPCCNQYKYEVLHLMDGTWYKVEGTRFVPIAA